MLQGVERLDDLIGPRESGLTGATLAEVESAVDRNDLGRLAETDGHFAAVAREGCTVRLARTIGLPLRYFVAKRYHGPYLVVSDRIDRLYDYCCSLKIGWQFDPLYTRMIPAHYLVEIDQIGCPDPNPRYHRFFDPEVAQGPREIDAAGDAYVRAAYDSTLDWIRGVPDGERIAILFSGGVDSGSTFLLARKALEALGRDPGLARAYTLDLGGGQDAIQAERWVRELGLEAQWERISLEGTVPDLEGAIATIEDYHPLDVECAATSLLLLGAIRDRDPSVRFLIDGDGGDENLKSYPLEDSDLTISSVLRNPLLYQEGWGIDAVKHSLTYSGGLSRSYVRTYAPAQKLGFTAFSPYTTRRVIAKAAAMPFEEWLGGDASRLDTLKADVVQAGVKSFTGVDMPVFPKRRFQDGAGGSYRRWKVSKAWCRQVFLRQWEERLKVAWSPFAERVSGNAVPT
ncbi:asparagine synthase-related protein [Planctomyces sp. SH-PL62]|uniref:asparagine synthase-related protein n=1 Tax=Planctomyces sp. SH-PL62 TaxID=1636152 RepID=UPI00078DCC30|nr:asparagine synthase-related protein [Planctomyces sp. SH-PL62]AMV38361.1 Asparagine synthase [Planctomyces sp. SH-PL62]